MQTSSHVNEMRQCNCDMCRMMRRRGKSFSEWGLIRREYREMFNEILKGGDLENYNKNMATRDYDA